MQANKSCAYQHCVQEHKSDDQTVHENIMKHEEDMALVKSKFGQLTEVIQDMAEQIKYLERKITTINQRYIDNGEHIQLENNESYTVIKESVEEAITHINDEIIIKENTNQGQFFYCDLCKVQKNENNGNFFVIYSLSIV